MNTALTSERTNTDTSRTISENGGLSGVGALVCILVIGALLRGGLWYAFQDQGIYTDDEESYNQIATTLVQHGNFGHSRGEYTSIRPPLYPALVAGIYRVFGVENFQAVRLFQAILSLITVVIVYRLGSMLYSNRVGLWAAGLCCFYPSLLGFNNLLLTEVVFTFFLILFALQIVLALRRTSLTLIAVAGITLGLAALTRSVVWLFPPVFSLFLLFAWKRPILHRLAAAAVFVLTFAAVLAPWSVRNSRLQGTLVTVDVMGGRNFMMGNYEHTPLYRSWAAISIQGEKAWYRVVYKHSTPPAEGWTQGQLDKQALRHGLQFALNNPGITFLRDVIKFFDFWGLERTLVAGATQGRFGAMPKPMIGLLALVVFGSFVSTFLLGVFGIFVKPPADRWVHWFLLLLIAYICGMHTLVFGHSRYHLPLMPILMVYAGAVVVHLRFVWQQKNSMPFRLAAVVCAVFFVGWIWLAIVVDLQLVVQNVGWIRPL